MQNVKKKFCKYGFSYIKLVTLIKDCAKKEVFGGEEEREEVNVKRQPTGSKIIFYQDTQQTQKLDRFSFSLLCVCM